MDKKNRLTSIFDNIKLDLNNVGQISSGEKYLDMEMGSEKNMAKNVLIKNVDKYLNRLKELGVNELPRSRAPEILFDVENISVEETLLIDQAYKLALQFKDGISFLINNDDITGLADKLLGQVLDINRFDAVLNILKEILPVSHPDNEDGNITIAWTKVDIDKVKSVLSLT